jgi:hypothetical protein
MERKQMMKCCQYSYKPYTTSQSYTAESICTSTLSSGILQRYFDRPKTAVSLARAKMSLLGYQILSAPWSASQATSQHFLLPPDCPKVRPRRPSSILRSRLLRPIRHSRLPVWLPQG